jgi:outer membrane protein TolC
MFYEGITIKMTRYFGRHSPRICRATGPAVRLAGVVGATLAAATITSCGNLNRIDRHVKALIDEANTSIHSVAPHPTLDTSDSIFLADQDRDPLATKLPTVNPPADELRYTAKIDSVEVLERLEFETPMAIDPVLMGLENALGYAVTYSREHRFAQETYLLACLDLLIENHRFGPRFFNETTFTFLGDGNDGDYETALALVNDLGVRQRLKFGGELTAQVLVAAAEDLQTAVGDSSTQTADFILTADIPLLRGFGTVASEALIQSKREVIYAARAYERFRREFLFSIATDFSNLVVQQQTIGNQEELVISQQALAERERMRFEAGRIPFYELGLAENDAIDEADRLTFLREQYRLNVDSFKSRLGMSIDIPLVIMPKDLELLPPEISPNGAMRRAFALRLDLQNVRDRVDDARRLVKNAENALLPDLNIFGSVSMLTDDNEFIRRTLRIDPRDNNYRVGAKLGLPLDRTIEKVGVRQAEITLDRTRRAYEQFRDQIAIESRNAVRAINRAEFSLEIQRQNVVVARERNASVAAAPERASARDASDSLRALNLAQDGVISAKRDLQIAILEYLLDTGQLRVTNDGTLRLIPGMEVIEPDNAPQPMQDPSNLPGASVEGPPEGPEPTI